MNKKVKIVFLEREILGDDVDTSAFRELGDVIEYGTSTNEEAKERIKDAEIVVVNKVKINKDTLSMAKNLRLICEAATGIDNIDKAYTDEKGITVMNVKGYSTSAVAQHTFALLFYIYEKLRYYDDYVKSGEYQKSNQFSHFNRRFQELEGKTWGIIGLGEIGKKVAEIAEAFGCKAIYYSTSGKNKNHDYERAEFDTLLRNSDIISIHAPLTDATRELIDKEAFQKMKNTAVLLNLGRGAIINEKDLKEALETNRIAGAGLDVLSTEPMCADNPLASIQDSSRLVITPHMAWAATEARQRLTDEILNNMKRFLSN